MATVSGAKSTSSGWEAREANRAGVKELTLMMVPLCRNARAPRTRTKRARKKRGAIFDEEAGAD
jgi:hypothetical protein